MLGTKSLGGKQPMKQGVCIYIYFVYIIPVWPEKQSPFDTIHNIEQTVFLIENGFFEETENVFIIYFVFLRDDFPSS